MNTRKNELGSAIKVLQARKAVSDKPRPVKLYDKTHYLVVDIAGMSGIQNLLTEETKRKLGICTFDGKQLSSGRTLVIDSVRTQATKAVRAEIATWNDTSLLPGEIQGAQIRMSQGDDLLLDLPVADTADLKFDDYRAISSTPCVKPKQDIDFIIEFPAGVTVPNLKSIFVKFSFRCTEAKQ